MWGLPRHVSLSLLSEHVLERGIANHISQLIINQPGQEYYFGWKHYTAWRHLKNLDPNLASFFLENFGYAKLRAHGVYRLSGLSNLLLIAARTNWVMELVQDDLEKLFSEQEQFYRKLGELPAIAACFLIRHCSLLGHSAVALLESHVSPHQMAAMVKKHTPAACKHLFYHVSQTFEHKYVENFFDCFTEDEVYDSVFKHQTPSRINASFSDRLFKRFLDDDLLIKLQQSELREIQLFLRNISLHQFVDRHQAWVISTFEQPTIIDTITAKIEKHPPLGDIAYFILNLQGLSAETAELYVETMHSLDSAEIAKNTACSVEDLGLFLLSIWTSSPFSPLDFVSIEAIQNIINTNSANLLLSELLMMGGLVRTLELEEKINLPRALERLEERLMAFLVRFHLFLNEKKHIRRLQTTALRLALNIEGVGFLGQTISKTDVPDLFKDLRIITDTINSLERTKGVKSTMATDRKTQLLQRALKTILSWTNSN